MKIFKTVMRDTSHFLSNAENKLCLYSHFNINHKWRTHPIKLYVYHQQKLGRVFELAKKIKKKLFIFIFKD